MSGPLDPLDVTASSDGARVTPPRSAEVTLTRAPGRPFDATASSDGARVTRDAPPRSAEVTLTRAPGWTGDATAAPADPVGMVNIGRYMVLERLGEGGMGVVLAAYDPKLDRKVAIKLIHAVQRDDQERRLRMEREAQAMAKLSHPNVVTVYEVGEFAGQLFLAMEFVKGKDLRAWLRGRDRSAHWRAVLAMFLQAGEGLAAAHAAGLVHRDFKPKNRRPSPNAPQTPAGSQSHELGRFERVRGTRVVPV